MKKDSNNLNVSLKENKIKKKDDDYHDVDNIIYMADFQLKGEIEVQDISLINMVFDHKFRDEVYDKFDRNYVETDEEKEIFESMKRRR